MRRSRLTKPVTQWLTRCSFPIAVLGALLALDPILMGQHVAGGQSGGFSGAHGGGFSGAHGGGFTGGHAGGFSGGGFHGAVSAPGGFRGPSGVAPRSLGPAPRPYGPAPRMNWTGPRSSFVPERRTFPGYRPTYGVRNAGENRGDNRGWNRGGDRRDHRGDDRGWNGGDNRGDHHRGHDRQRDRGFLYSGYPYLYTNSWELLPWDLGYPDFTGYGDDTAASQPNDAQGEPAEEEQQEPAPDTYRPEYAPEADQPPANEAPASSPLRAQPELTLIFKDGHTQSIHNYMLTPRDVIVTDDAGLGRIPRIPLSDLNLPATEKAAQQAGLEFSPPSA